MTATKDRVIQSASGINPVVLRHFFHRCKEGDRLRLWKTEESQAEFKDEIARIADQYGYDYEFGSEEYHFYAILIR